METQKVFGRRTGSQPAPSRGSEDLQLVAPSPPSLIEDSVGRAAPAPRIPVSARFDDGLHEWKQARRQAYRIPWRQLLLMASLCFGIAAFVLPDTVNDNLDWLLYGLMAASFFAGLRRRKA